MASISCNIRSASNKNDLSFSSEKVAALTCVCWFYLRCCPQFTLPECHNAKLMSCVCGLGMSLHNTISYLEALRIGVKSSLDVFHM